VLSVAEKQRAEAFLKPEDRERYLLSHLWLREILSSYEPAVEAAEWCFRHNRFGKPLLDPFQKKGFWFNLSHSQETFALVCTDLGSCGIDVEEQGGTALGEGVHDLVFSKEEGACFERLLPEEKEAYFYRIWTLKEAELKALGSGLLEAALTEIDFHQEVELEKESYTFVKEGAVYWQGYEGERSVVSLCLLNGGEMIYPKVHSLD